MKKLETSRRSQEDDDELEKKGAIVFNATSEFCRTLGEIPTYGLAGNREDQEELMVGFLTRTVLELWWSRANAFISMMASPCSAVCGAGL